MKTYAPSAMPVKLAKPKPMCKFTKGQDVWLYFFSPQGKEGKATAEIRKRVFVRSCYPNWAQGKLRYTVARRAEVLPDAALVAYSPDRVFATRADAVCALRMAIAQKSAELLALQDNFTES